LLGDIGMLGIQDNWVALAYILCIASTALCLVYGFFYWNKDGAQADAADKKWIKEEKKVEEEL
jgi:TRAP-type C4-dicarboxylate transport system permease small subunit